MGVVRACKDLFTDFVELLLHTFGIVARFKLEAPLLRFCGKVLLDWVGALGFEVLKVRFLQREYREHTHCV